MTDVKQLLSLIADVRGIDVPKLEELPLYSVAPHSFLHFLTMDRINPLLQLRVLNHVWDKKFFCGCLETQYSRLDEGSMEDEYEQKSLGVSFVNKLWSAEHIFNLILALLGISQVIIGKVPHLEYQPRETQTGLVLTKNFRNEMWEEFLDYPVYLSEDLQLVLSGKSIFVADTKMIQEIINYKKDEIDAFLQEQKDAVTIDHQQYVKWLLEWFPGRVSIRSLK